MQKLVALRNLRFGHEHEPPINVRKVGRDENVEGLANSIEHHGLGQALNVIEQGDLAFVEDGNRRLAALRLIEKRGNITADTLIKCEIQEKEGLASGELGLALNFEREPMHEADQYEKFFELHRAGHTSSQIASRFGIEERRVSRFLALGGIAPEILEAWRRGDDRFEAEGFEIVPAFTLAPNIKEQLAVFKRLKKAGRLFPTAIRQAFGADNGQAARNLPLVGKDEYVKAGGKITEDLFGDNHAIADRALLQQLATAKINDLLTALRRSWSWAELSSDLPYGWNYSWERVKGGKSASAESRKKAGCVVELRHDGSLEVTYGLMKPAQSRKDRSAAVKTAKTADQADKNAQPPVSNALANRLSLALTRAVQHSIGAKPNIALAALLAGLGSRATGPVRLRKDGVGDYEAILDAERFAALFARYAKKPLDQLLAAVGPAMAKAITMQTFSSSALPLASADNMALIEQLDPVAFAGAMTEQFDANDYFCSVPKPVILRAITDGSQCRRSAQG